MTKLCPPVFEDKDHGKGADIPVLKTIWDLFDLSLLFLQTGIRKHSGISAWLLAFSYICGLVHNVQSVNKNAEFTADTPILQQVLAGKKVSQSAFSRFLGKPFDWLKFSQGRLSRLQEHPECRLNNGDVIAPDDTKIEHPYGKKIPFLCWLFDSSDKRNVWCMNLISTPLSLNMLTSHMWNYCLLRKRFFAMLIGNAIKKALNKPFPSAKRSGTFSTPIVGSIAATI